MKKSFEVLGLPVALAVVLSGAALLLGIDLDQAGEVAVTLFGMAALLAFVINVLKWGGVVDDGMAGKLSAAGNLLVLAAVAIVNRWYPQVDIYAVDRHVLEFVKVASLVFVYVAQIITSKQSHRFMVDVLGISSFSHKVHA